MSSNRSQSKKQELEDLRKNGVAPAEVDSEGKMINPHIPQYIAQAPWYLNTETGLKHQRLSIGEKGESSWYKRGEFAGPAATKYRKGACTNCGSMTHDQKSCFSRPRQKGAKFTQQDIQPDEIIQDIKLDFDGKRDRWNGYDNSEYKKSVDAFERMEEVRKKKKEAEILAGKAEKLSKGISDSDSDKSDDEMKDTGELIQTTDDKTRQTVRNLRIREDTVKFLRNINSDTFFDPKTRSMRGNPFPDQDPNSLVYAGDNFIRSTGDVKKFNELEVFSWEAADHGQNIHIASNPSLSEMMFQQHKKKKEEAKTMVKQNILDKYGGAEHLGKKEVVSQAETYVEFAPDGRMIKGQELAIPKSKYNENIFDGNHTSVWGSYWKDGLWAYSCCHSSLRNSYCVGTAGIDSKALPLQEKLVNPLKRKNSEKSNENDETSSEKSDNDD